MTSLELTEQDWDGKPPSVHMESADIASQPQWKKHKSAFSESLDQSNCFYNLTTPTSVYLTKMAAHVYQNIHEEFIPMLAVHIP